jgi:multicomponent Na+:H+ antiporter subunit G
MTIASYVFMLLGGLFLALGGFGVFRMPDVFNRIQAGTKATTLGAFSLTLGVGLANPSWLLKVVLIIVFIAVTNPVGSSVLARAAYKAGAARYEKPVPEGKEGDRNESV